MTKSKERPDHFRNYERDMTEIVPGVFVIPGDSVYIVDDTGEVVSWNSDEWQEDPNSVTATVNAVAIATKWGAFAVRRNIDREGAILTSLVVDTHEKVCRCGE